MEMQLVHITPEIASAWMADRPVNRNVAQQSVTKIKSDIVEGRWVLNGETIKLDEMGRLIDGQHRLTAIAEAGVAVDSWVLFGAPSASMSTIDVGRVRSAGDMLKIDGVANSNAIASIVALVLKYQNFRNHKWNGIGVQISKAQVVQHYRDHQAKVDAAADLYIELKRKLGVRTSYGAFAYLVAESPHGYELARFHEGLATGAGLATDDPRLVLRNQISAPAIPMHTEWRTQRDVAIFIKAYNKFLHGQSISRLTFGKDDVMPTVGGA